MVKSYQVFSRDKVGLKMMFKGNTEISLERSLCGKFLPRMECHHVL
jgi:hypothetical protein